VHNIIAVCDGKNREKFPPPVDLRTEPAGTEAISACSIKPYWDEKRPFSFRVIIYSRFFLSRRITIPLSMGFIGYL
jgi:hypothetical protein